MSRRAAFLAHPTVRALLDADVTTSEPDVAIRRRARDLVAWARGMGWDGPPFDLELLASLCGFRVEYTPLGARQDGWIDSWRRRILINAEMHELRQRFTLAHEIAHTLLPDFGLGTSSVDVDGDYEWAEQSPPEQLCQVAAAELLMPADAFREACGDAAATVDGVRSVAERFQASIPAAARQWIVLSPRSAALIIAKPARTRGNRPAVLRVIASVRGGGKPLFLKNATVPADSVIHHVWERAHRNFNRPCSESAVEDWSTAELGRCRVEAVTLPLQWLDPDAVLALLHSEHTP
jgi:Zn-dependent peptidase ImmA (M78 family)